MKNRKIAFFLIVTAFILSSYGTSYTLSLSYSGYMTNTTTQCSNPTSSLVIGVISGETAFNVTSLTAPSNTCVKVVFQDNDPNVAHSFTINADSANGVAQFNIYDTAGSTGTSNFMTPNANITLTYFCAVPGHYDTGMHGTLTVGTVSTSSGKKSPGFEMITVFMGLFALVAISTIIKKKN